MMKLYRFRFCIRLGEIAEALRIQGRDDGHQNGGDDHAGGNQRRCLGRNRFESRVNLGNDHRIRHGGPGG